MKNFALSRTLLLGLTSALLLVGCSSTEQNQGAYFQNDGPPNYKEWHSVGEFYEPTPKVEKIKTSTNKPYTVFGKKYVPVTQDIPMRQTGVASWYGKQFHGNKTSTGEIYDMYKMTAAHPTMPLPSYARVTNLDNGRSVIVRVNDRGPFLHSRVIDLSYAAATELGYAKKGTANVEVVRLTNADIQSGRWKNPSASKQNTQKSPTAPTQSQLDKVYSSASTGWSVQLAVFSNAANAEAYVAHAEALLTSHGINNALRIIREGGRYRVVVGQRLSHEKASALAQKVKSIMGIGAFAIQK